MLISSLLEHMITQVPSEAAAGFNYAEEADAVCPCCQCSKSVGLLRTLHIEGLPLSVTAAEVSELMSFYGPVQYAEAAPDVVKDEIGVVVARKLHCYVVFADHLGACLAKRSLMPKGADAVGAKDQALRVRFAKPQSVVPACTAPFKAFVTSQWATVCAAAKASPELKRPSCKINALFISKLHQHITSGRLCAHFGKFGKMIACEVQYHSDGRSAGHGVVIYETIEDAERALLATNGYRLEGRAIEVTPLRLKKLPSKLEHLKGRIMRLPCSADGSCSEDGSSVSCATLSTPRMSGAGSLQGAATTPLAAAAAMAAAAAAQTHGQMPLAALEQQINMAAAAAAAAAANMNMSMAAANNMNMAAAAHHFAAGMPPNLAGMGLPLPPSAAAAAAALNMAGLPMPGYGMPMGMPPGMPFGFHGPHGRAPGEGVPPGLDLSFLA